MFCIDSRGGGSKCKCNNSTEHILSGVARADGAMNPLSVASLDQPKESSGVEL